MIINKSNFTTIATKFLEKLEGVKIDRCGPKYVGFPRYINIWPEKNVHAIRNVVGDGVTYDISINHKLVTSIMFQCNKFDYQHSETVDNIVTLLYIGTQKYIQDAIEKEVESILVTVRDYHFTTGNFPGGLHVIVNSIQTDMGDMRFIDFYQHGNLVYSAPHSAGYENQLSDVLTELFSNTHQTNGLVISIP